MGDFSELILLTGATGYVAAHTVVELVSQGFRVRGTVRSLRATDRYEYLYDLCGGDSARSKIEFVECDLENPSSETWDALVLGCSACVHMAAPVKLTVSDVQRELVDPMLAGISNLFQAMQRSETCKRVVFTSSASTLSDNFPKWKTKVYGPQDWNTVSTATRNPYMYAKTLAERAAHEFVTREGNTLTLACVLPFQIIGPSLDPNVKQVNGKCLKFGGEN
jgi:dihydroflavonol-4-reductase